MPRPMQILARTGAAADHPVASGVPESEYLKAVWMRRAVATAPSLWERGRGVRAGGETYKRGNAPLDPKPSP